MAENYLAEIEEVYAKLKEKWHVLVVGLVTDASGESRKARRLFAHQYPSLIVLDCYSHQVSGSVDAFSKFFLTLNNRSTLSLVTFSSRNPHYLLCLPLRSCIS